MDELNHLIEDEPGVPLILLGALWIFMTFLFISLSMLGILFGFAESNFYITSIGVILLMIVLLSAVRTGNAALKIQTFALKRNTRKRYRQEIEKYGLK